MGSNDGTKRMTAWIMGIFAVLFTAGAVGWASTINGHVSSYGERIRATEVHLEGVKGHLQRIERRQETMDQKLDRLLERIK